MTCFLVDPIRGLIALDSAPREISQALNQTTPPVGPFSTASDIRFNPSSSALIATVKGTPATTPVTPGYIFAWPVVGNNVSTTAVVSKIDSIILDFSVSFTRSDFTFLVTDPALGGDFVGVSSNLTMEVERPVNITYQKAACWSTYDPSTGVVYIADAAQTNITVLSSEDGSIKETIDFSPAVRGGLDLGIAGTNLFVLATNGEVVSIDISGVGAGKTARQIQVFDPLPSGNKSMSLLNGLGVFISSA